MADIKYEITEELGVLSEKSSGWTKELNRISWNLSLIHISSRPN